MSNDLAAIGNAMDLWDNEKRLSEIKAIYAPKLNDHEFAAFIGMGKANDLNPFLKEIWAIKYDEKAPAQIFIGRDGYRKSAQRNPDYSHHQVEAVYSNDIYQYTDGVIRHSYTAHNRGDLLGAYCRVYKHSNEQPISVYCPLNEYSTGKSLWNKDTGKPATMIKKVAEAQCLRMAFQEQYKGTYSEFEDAITVDGQLYIPKQTQASKISSLISKKGFNNAKASTIIENANYSNNSNSFDSDNIIHTEDIDSQGSANEDAIRTRLAEDRESESSDSNSKDAITLATASQLESIEFMCHEKKLTKERRLKALDHFNVASFIELSFQQADEMIEILGKLA